MSETYTVTAKTVDEAINLANQLYGGRNKEISHEIISTPRKGFLGIGSKDAIIRVTVVDTGDDGLGSLVDEIKSYKTQSVPETGYYTHAAETKPEQKRPEQKKAEHKKPEQKKPEQKKPEQKKSEQKKSEDKKPEQKKPSQEKENKQGQEAKTQVDNNQPKAAKKDENLNAAPKAEKAEKPEKAEQSTKPQKQEKNHKKSKKPSNPEKNTKPAKTEKTKTDLRAGDDVKLKVAVSEDEMKFALEFIDRMVADMKLSANAIPVVAPEGEEFVVTETETVYPAVVIEGEDTGILIGHHGETLDAIQYLVNLALFRRNSGEKGGRENIKITVDIENYREKREETLRALARRMAARAVKYKRNVFLEPMNPYERRIIHSELQNYPDVATHSVGSDTNRKINITYEGADKSYGNKKRGKNNRRPSTHSPAVSEPEVPQGMPLPTLDDIEE